MDQPASSSWLAAYQRAVDTASSQTKTLRTFIAEKQAALGMDGLEDRLVQLRETVDRTVERAARGVREAGTTTMNSTTTNSTSSKEAVTGEEMAREMEAYGVTDEFVEAVRSKLEYGIFRDYKLEDSPSRERRLNAWQERHVILLLRRVKEVDALRYALCPKVMDDGVFWAIYFDLVRKMLPGEAYTYREGGGVVLPRRYEDVVEERCGGGKFVSIESRFREIGERLRGGGSGKKEQEGGIGEDERIEERIEERIDERIDSDLEEYLQAVVDDGDDGDDAPLDDDELDAYLDTLALSD